MNIQNFTQSFKNEMFSTARFEVEKQLDDWGFSRGNYARSMLVGNVLGAVSLPLDVSPHKSDKSKLRTVQNHIPAEIDTRFLTEEWVRQIDEEFKQSRKPTAEEINIEEIFSRKKKTERSKQMDVMKLALKKIVVETALSFLEPQNRVRSV